MDRTQNHTVSPIDENHLLYGNFIGLQYVFKTGLDVETLASSVALLSEQFPVLSRRYIAKSGKVTSTGRSVALRTEQSSRSVKDILASSERPDCVTLPKRRDVLRGRAPLSTFTLTQLEDGAAIFGMAISHVLTDAAGFHMLIQHLANIYTAFKSDKALPAFPFTTQLKTFDFGTQRSKPETLNILKHRCLPKPIPIKGMLGSFVKSMIIKAMDKSISDNPPISIHFTPDHFTRLKQTVLTESGEDWISTNVALCAHFTSIMARSSYGDDLKTEIQIGQLLDLRNRYFEDTPNEQSQYVGNAILIHIDKAEFPVGLQNTSRGALARYFKHRQTKTGTPDVKDKLDLLADCLRHGYTNPELDVKNPIISLNNQSKMNIYDVNFDGQRPERIYPQDVGDNIMFFPAADGGIEIHIRDIVNPLRQQDLLMPEWQKQIFDF